jgi:hypothetical protein
MGVGRSRVGELTGRASDRARRAGPWAGTRALEDVQERARRCRPTGFASRLCRSRRTRSWRRQTADGAPEAARVRHHDEVAREPVRLAPNCGRAGPRDGEIPRLRLPGAEERSGLREIGLDNLVHHGVPVAPADAAHRAANHAAIVGHRGDHRELRPVLVGDRGRFEQRALGGSRRVEHHGDVADRGLVGSRGSKDATRAAAARVIARLLPDRGRTVTGSSESAVTDIGCPRLTKGNPMTSSTPLSRGTLAAIFAAGCLLAQPRWRRACAAGARAAHHGQR